MNSLRIVDALFAAGPTDMGVWSRLLDANAHLRIGSRPPAVGRAAVLGELGAFLAGVAAIGRGYREVWALEEATLVETDVVPRPKGIEPSRLPEQPLPCAMVFRTGSGALALDLRFYLDPGPVFGRRPGRADGRRSFCRGTTL